MHSPAQSSNPRLNAMSCEIMNHCSFADDFVSEERCGKNAGCSTNRTSSTISEGFTSDGSGSIVYDAVSQPSTFSVVVKFKSSTLSNKIIFSNISTVKGFAITTTSTGITCYSHDGLNVTDVNCSVDIDYSDNEIHTVTYVVDYSAGTQKLYVDALDLNSQTSTISLAIGDDNVVVGSYDVASSFDGTIYKTRIFDTALSLLDHGLYCLDNMTDWFINAMAIFRCDAINDDTVGHKILDRSDGTNDITKANGIVITSFPVFVPASETSDACYNFGGFSYISDLPDLPVDYTISACQATSATAWPTVVQHNDLTFLSTLEDATFVGVLRSLIMHTSILSAIQLSHDKYQHLYWQWRGRAFGEYHRLITDGNCVFAMFLDDAINTFDDYSENEADGVATMVDKYGLDGCTFRDPASNVESPHETGLSVDNITISVLGTFGFVMGATTLVDKGTNYKLIINLFVLELNGSSIRHSAINFEHVAVTAKIGDYPKFFINGKYVGLGDTLFARTQDTSNLTVGSNNEHNNATYDYLKHIYIGNEPLTDDEIGALYEQARYINTIEM